MWVPCWMLLGFAAFALPEALRATSRAIRSGAKIIQIKRGISLPSLSASKQLQVKTPLGIFFIDSPSSPSAELGFAAFALVTANLLRAALGKRRGWQLLLFASLTCGALALLCALLEVDAYVRDHVQIHDDRHRSASFLNGQIVLRLHIGGLHRRCPDSVLADMHGDRAG